MLTAQERERYDRQIMIQGFGEEGQEKLKKARVLIAGAGGPSI
jgi:molybdopterin/thiamine biosynthesis adenylyltransferase